MNDKTIELVMDDNRVAGLYQLSRNIVDATSFGRCTAEMMVHSKGKSYHNALMAEVSTGTLGIVLADHNGDVIEGLLPVQKHRQTYIWSVENWLREKLLMRYK